MVTGGAGFIGSNLVNVLLESNEVAVVDDLSTGSMANVNPSARFRRLNVLDPSLADVAREFGPEAIVHLAAQPSVTASIADPEHDWSVNHDGTLAVARLAVECGARRVISASSAAVYGTPECVPLPETAPKSPENPYGRSKLAAESALAETLRGTEVDFASLRFANVFGPRQDWRGEGGVVAVFAARMLADTPPVVHGSGRQTRDFVFVGDVVGAIIACLECEPPLAGAGDDGPAYNVATGTETSVEELVITMKALSGYVGPIEREPGHYAGVDRSALDPTKAAEQLGWRASAKLENALAVTLRWFRQGG